MPRVEGFVLLPESEPALYRAQVRVLVEETGRADAASTVLAEQVISGIPQAQIKAGRLPFVLEVDSPAPQADCSIRAHIDLDGDGSVSPGDYVSVEHIPLPESPQAAPIAVAVRRVSSHRP